jgi:hypothetical protein
MTSDTILQQISDVAWLVHQGNERVGLLNKGVQEDYTFISGKNLVNFQNEDQVIQHFGNLTLFEEQNQEPITTADKCYIRGYEVKYEDPYVLERGHPDYRDDIPLYAKIEGSSVYYAAGHYCINFGQAWKTANCPKLSTLTKYGFEGPWREAWPARQRMRDLNKQKKNDA